MKKKLAILSLIGLMLLKTTSVVYAGTLDDIIKSKGSTVEKQVEVQGNTVEQSVQSGNTDAENYQGANSYINDIRRNSDLTQYNSPGAEKVNSGLRNIAAFIVKVLSYGITIFLVVRVMLDLTYIVIPFSRGILGNGLSGNQVGGSQQNGFGSNSGFGGSSFGGGFGSSSFGGSSGFGSGMTEQNRHQQGGLQFVSNAALNAVASEGTPGPSGKPQSAFRYYTKDMLIILVVTPILLTLALTGGLTNLGFLIGEALSNALNSISSFM